MAELCKDWLDPNTYGPNIIRRPVPDVEIGAMNNVYEHIRSYEKKHHVKFRRFCQPSDTPMVWPSDPEPFYWRATVPNYPTTPSLLYGKIETLKWSTPVIDPVTGSWSTRVDSVGVEFA